MTREHIADGGFVIGVALVVTGLAGWSIPLAMVVCGALICAISALVVYRATSSPSTPPTHGSSDHAS